MILADTNIIIDYLKGNSLYITSVIDENSICICGVILAELLRGCKSKKDFTSVKEALSDFDYINFSERNWEDVSDVFIRMRRKGLSVPFQDVMIAVVAIENNCEVLTRDNHFKMIRQAVPELKLFEGVAE